MIPMANVTRWMHGAAFLMGTCLLALCVSPAASAQDQPSYKVDPTWPKPLPNNWIMGMVRGLAVDRENHIWVLHGPGSVDADQLGAAQTPPRAECCVPAPPVLEFDTQGNLLKSWGGPASGDAKKYDWFSKEHSIFVDPAGNVWLSGNDAPDRQVLKFTSDGKFLLQIGHAVPPKPEHSLDKTLVGAVAGFDIDEKAHEIYMADGPESARHRR